MRADALKDHDGMLPIVPGKPEESELVTRVYSTDKDEVMPPPKAKKALKPEQKELLKKWIAEGAEYRMHWAFEAVKAPPVPEPAKAAGSVDLKAWSQNFD